MGHMTGTHLGVVLRAPSILLDLEVFLPQLVDQPGERPDEAFLHGHSKGAQPLRMILIVVEDNPKLRVPCVKASAYASDTSRKSDAETVGTVSGGVSAFSNISVFSRPLDQGGH